MEVSQRSTDGAGGAQGGSTALIAVACGAVVLILVGLVVLVIVWLKPDDKLRIYSSLPLQGPQAKQAEDMVNAMKLALKQAKGKAGEFEIEYISRDDSTQAGTFTDATVAKNALDAATDPLGVGYIGDFNSGATAVAIPILSVAKVPQISPASTATGLTVRGESSDPGEPGSHYYHGYRNFVRIVPHDTVQADALARLMKGEHCSAVAMVNDGGVYGRRLARDMRGAVKRVKLRMPFDKTIGTRERRLPALAATKPSDCFLYSGATTDRAVRFFTAMAEALPDARLYGPDGLSETAFTDGQQGGIPAKVAERTTLTVPALGRDDYGPLGARFYEDYEREYDDASPEVYAIYAYEAMSLLLDAIERSGSGKRQDIVTALRTTRSRDSALGKYSIDSNGDTTRRDYGVYEIKNGRPMFVRAIDTR